MNSLWYVVLYHFDQNAFARYHITAGSGERAAEMAIENAGNGWRIRKTVYVCHTNNDIYQEV